MRVGPCPGYYDSARSRLDRSVEIPLNAFWWDHVTTTKLSMNET